MTPHSSLTILHGDHKVASRKILNQLIDAAKAKGVKDIIRLSGKTLTPTDLTQATQAQTFFGTDRRIVIENLLTRPQSKIKQAIITHLSNISQKKSPSYPIILWDAKSLTKAQLKPFSQAKIQEFKTPTIIFTFLDSLKPNHTPVTLKLLRQAIAADSPESVFYMLNRQVRMLLQSGDPDFKLAPWQMKKIKHQSALFGEATIIGLHQRLLEIDERIKTGRSGLGLAGELDLLIATL